MAGGEGEAERTRARGDGGDEPGFLRVRREPSPWWRRPLDALLGGTGARGERAVARFLRREGYRILARNFRVPGGEADLIAEKGDLVVAVEVKTRTGRGGGEALRAITPGKARRVKVAAVAFCRREGISLSRLRLDAASVERDGWRFRVTHFPGALAGL